MVKEPGYTVCLGAGTAVHSDWVDKVADGSNCAVWRRFCTEACDVLSEEGKVLEHREWRRLGTIDPPVRAADKEASLALPETRRLEKVGCDVLKDGCAKES